MRAIHILPAFGLLGLSALPAAAQTPLPAPADAAIGAAETRFEPGQRWAFTTTVQRDDSRLTARFDPSLPEGARWTLIEPVSESELDDVEEEILDSLRQTPEPDIRLQLGPSGEKHGLRAFVAEEIAEDFAAEGAAGEPGHYRFTPQGDVGLAAPPPGPQNAMDELEGQLVLAGGMPVRVRIFAAEPFKPNAVSKIETLDLYWDFGEMAPGGPIGIVRTDSAIRGGALLQKFDSRTIVLNSEFERVDIP